MHPISIVGLAYQKYMKLVIVGNSFSVMVKDSTMFHARFELFVIIDPRVIKSQYVYYNGTTVVNVSQSIDIVTLKDHIEVLPSKRHEGE